MEFYIIVDMDTATALSFENKSDVIEFVKNSNCIKTQEIKDFIEDKIDIKVGEGAICDEDLFYIFKSKLN
jgi:hypothetical protein